MIFLKIGFVFSIATIRPNAIRHRGDAYEDNPNWGIYRKPMGEYLFEEEFTIDALSQMGNPLERLAALVDFEMFRSD